MAMRFATQNRQVSDFMGGMDLNLIGESAMKSQSSMNQAAILGEGKTLSTGLDSLGQVKSAAEMARGITGVADAQAAGMDSRAWQSAVKPILGGLGGLSNIFGGGGGGGGLPTSGVGEFGAKNYMNNNFGLF